MSCFIDKFTGYVFQEQERKKEGNYSPNTKRPSASRPVIGGTPREEPFQFPNKWFDGRDKREHEKLQNEQILRGFSALGIETGPFAAL